MQPVKPTRPHAAVLALAALAAIGSVPAARALEITLPPETARYTPSELPGYRLVQQNCMTCHSAQYVLTQPPSSPRGYWDTTVKKMKKPFGAPFPDEDIPAMVDYLAKTYGAERTAYAGKAAAQANTPAPAAALPRAATIPRPCSRPMAAPPAMPSTRRWWGRRSRTWRQSTRTSLAPRRW
ncbi:SorB family sulfite dehydrogenase c-type cytochrome subunit [Cupriavidus basilensis]